jgi:uncharacterized RDD family membrane protein YckC
MDNEYYILDKGERIGPFTTRELMARPLEPGDIILQPAQTQGIPAYSMPEFSDYFKLEGIYYPTQQNTGNYILRLPAFIIDYFILVFGIMILALLIFPKQVLEIEQMYTPQPFTYEKYIENIKSHQNEALIMQLVLFIIMIVYNAACEAGRLRGSVGKYVMGLAVVDELGYSITFLHALKRNLGKWIYEIASFVIGPLAYLFYLRMIWGDRHQAFHDRFADCYVVKKRA